MNSAATPEGPGSAAGAPHLPDGFAGTFTSRYVDTGDLRQHVVTGGDGPPLLLVHGWPQTWYAWRLMMPALARDFQVIAPDQRGIGLSGRPADGYDTGTLAADLAALMDALGHERFAVFGHDTGMWIGYALAADHPGRVTRLAVAETPLPGVSPSPPLFTNAHLNNALWHFAFNRLADVNDRLVAGREDVYFGWQFAAKAARPLPDYAVRHYIGTLAADPAALHASFAMYRALDTTIAQNQQRMTRRLTLPVLGIGGEKSLRDQVASTMKLAADDVRTEVIPGCGHHPPEEAPEETLAGGLSAAGTVSASAATPQCGSGCIQIFSAKYGTNFIETVFLGIPAPGVPTVLHRASSTNPAEDLIVPTGMPVMVSDFYADHLVSEAVESHYGGEPAVQVEYAPYGKPTGLCAALATTAYQNEGLSLEPCSTPGTTVWIIDVTDSPGTTYFPLVNGSTTDFAHPFGMVMPVNPAHALFPRILVQHLIGNPTDVPADQLWGSTTGVVS